MGGSQSDPSGLKKKLGVHPLAAAHHTGPGEGGNAPPHCKHLNVPRSFPPLQTGQMTVFAHLNVSTKTLHAFFARCCFVPSFFPNKWRDPRVPIAHRPKYEARGNGSHACRRLLHSLHCPHRDAVGIRSGIRPRARSARELTPTNNNNYWAGNSSPGPPNATHGDFFGGALCLDENVQTSPS